MPEFNVISDDIANLIGGISSRQIPSSTYPRQLLDPRHDKIPFNFNNGSIKSVSLSIVDGLAEITFVVSFDNGKRPDFDKIRDLGHFCFEAKTSEKEEFKAYFTKLKRETGYVNEEIFVFNSSQWLLGGNNAVVWTGALNGPLPFSIGNLMLWFRTDTRKGQFNSNFFLQGTKTNYFLMSQPFTFDFNNANNKLIVDFLGRPFDHQTLYREFRVLSFASGNILNCKLLVGIDGHGNIVGYAGTAFGFPALKQSRTASPLPQLYIPRLLPGFFHKLVTMLERNDHKSKLLSNAISLFVESLAETSFAGIEIKLFLCAVTAAKLHLPDDFIFVNRPAAMA